MSSHDDSALFETVPPRGRNLPGGAFALLLASLIAGAWLLPVLPLVPVLILWLGFGIMAGVPFAANASAARAHALRIKSEANPIYWLLRGGVLRVLVCSLIGLGGTAVLLTGLARGGAVDWLAALAGAGVALAVMRGAGGIAARLDAPVHDAARLRRWAILLGALATVAVSIIARFLVGLPALMPEQAAMSAVVSEALGAHRMVQGMLIWMLGAASAVDLFGPAVEAFLAALMLGMSGVSIAALAVASLMAPGEWSRAVSVASDLPDAPPPQGAALWALGLFAAGGIAAGIWAETRLAAMDPQARPVAQVQVIVERIGAAFYPDGTHARIVAGRDALAARDADALAELRGLTDRAFDAMAGQVDPFLDEYYSLRAEYLRLGVALMGMVSGGAEAAVAAHLGERLAETLGENAYLDAVSETLAVLDLPEMRAAQEAEESALLANRAEADVNPARLRIVSQYPTLDPLPELRSLGFTSRLETRIGGSVALGVVGAVIARRVVMQLARRGVLRIGARALLATIPLIGTAIVVGSDAAALALEEHFNRAAFRTEILDALEEQRREILAVMDEQEAAAVRP